MPISSALDLLAITATIVGSAMALPQARRLARHRTVEGVSATWIGVSAALNGWWIAYAIAAGVWAVLPVSVISAVLYVTIGVFYLRTAGRRGVPAMLLGAAVLGMVPLPFLVARGWTVAGVAVGLCYGVQLLPAVVTAYRTRELSGISPSTWLIGWIESTLWLAFGVGIADPAVIAGGLTGATMSLAILVRLGATGHASWRDLHPRLAAAR